MKNKFRRMMEEQNAMRQFQVNTFQSGDLHAS